LDIKEKYKKALANYIPANTLDIIAEWILHFNFNLKIMHERSTKLGDYRSPYQGKRHFITVNHNLNKYAFLITLIHEIAHLTTYNKYKNKVKPHGAEWKEEYRVLMQRFLKPEIFPEDILKALFSYMLNPAAASCSDANLLRVLKKYDTNNYVLLEQLSKDTIFEYNKRRFQKGEKIRKNFRCVEVSTKAVYIFSPLAEVTKLEIEKLKS
jgi:SprT protein